ncbi:MAG: hypothetical protein ACW980_25685 [Promethearchaeota archaeon]|jgi:hypothetical protein
MDSKSKEIILRHLKGIINELEKNLKRDKELKQIKVYMRQFDVKKVKMSSTKPVVN